MEDPRDAKAQARKDHDVKATKHHVDYLKMLDNKQGAHDRHNPREEIRQVPSGQPKKDGGGGKYTWGTTQDDIDQALPK